MRDRDLAEYLEHDPFLEPSASQPKATPSIEARPKPDRVAPEPPTRTAGTARAQFASDMLHLVLSVFTGARWTTRDEYTRAAAQRDRKGRKRRG
jgi:hypothetical protein